MTAPAAPPPVGSALATLPPGLPRRRPAVLDASRTALIPLRPLTIGEILDGAFLIVRRNVSLMLGLPLVVAGGTALYVLAGVGLWLLLGNTTARSAQIVLVVVMGLLGLLLLQQCLVWMTAILSRVSLQTVLGPGFAPAARQVTLRSSWPLFWPVLGLSVLQYLVVNVAQTAVGLLYYGLSLGAVLAAAESEVLSIVLAVLLLVLTFAVTMVIYGYLSLTVPALALESRRAPGWIGKPAQPTTVITAFSRAFALIGRGNLIRVSAVIGGAVAVCAAVVALVAVGVSLMLWLFATSISLDVLTLLANPWTIFAVVGVSVLLTMSTLLAYLSAVQTLLYLDLRMRREALDLAMRFDCLPIPQPVAPPLPPPPGPIGWGPPR